MPREEIGLPASKYESIIYSLLDLTFSFPSKRKLALRFQLSQASLSKQ